MRISPLRTAASGPAENLVRSWENLVPGHPPTTESVHMDAE